MRSGRFALAFLSILFAATGCGPGGPLVGGKDRPSPPPRSAVSLSPGCTEIIKTKGYTLRLLGQTAACNYPFVDKEAKIVMKGTKPNYELIATLGPELVVYDPDLFSESDIAKFEEIGIPTFALGGKTVNEFIDRLYRFGTLTGTEMLVSSYVEDIYRAREQGKATALDSKPRVAVMIAGQGGEHMIAGTESFYADVIRAAGGEPVGPKSEMFVAINAESLVKTNPDVIVASGADSPIAKDPRFSSISAIRKGRLISVDPDILLRRGSRVPTLIRGLSSTIVAVMKTPPATVGASN